MEVAVFASEDPARASGLMNKLEAAAQKAGHRLVWHHSPPKTVGSVDYAVVVTNMLGTTQHESIVKLCKSKGIPFIRSVDAWAVLMRHCTRVGLQFEALPAPVPVLVPAVQLDAQAVVGLARGRMTVEEIAQDQGVRAVDVLRVLAEEKVTPIGFALMSDVDALVGEAYQERDVARGEARQLREDLDAAADLLAKADETVRCSVDEGQAEYFRNQIERRDDQIAAKAREADSLKAALREQDATHKAAIAAIRKERTQLSKDRDVLGSQAQVAADQLHEMSLALAEVHAKLADRGQLEAELEEKLRDRDALIDRLTEEVVNLEAEMRRLKEAVPVNGMPVPNAGALITRVAQLAVDPACRDKLSVVVQTIALGLVDDPMPLLDRIGRAA